MAGEIAARVYRGEAVEAVHRVSVAVVDAAGKLTHTLGDPDHVTMARSAIKPFQALPLILTGAADHFGFSAEQLSIMCGSHNGTDEHRALVVSILERIGCTSDDLQCGAHLPIFMRVNELYPSDGEDRDPARNNCSGKHAGFLALAKFLKDDIKDYLNPECKSQEMVREMVGRMTGMRPGMITVSVDGCSAPNFSVTPYHLALGFRRLACGQGDEPEVSRALVRVKAAMSEHPRMYSGEKRFDYDLMRSFPGNVVCKVGAEALEGIGFSDPPVGIAVKVHDGNTRALWPICVEVLRQLGLVAKAEEFPYLVSYVRPEVLNARRIVTGHVETGFQLRKV
ncbi:MAG TPA: asparaginase [Acidobacteriota bacterium]|nr:asparaginase [Acidobacteriota bacterium]